MDFEQCAGPLPLIFYKYYVGPAHVLFIWVNYNNLSVIIFGNPYKSITWMEYVKINQFVKILINYCNLTWGKFPDVCKLIAGTPGSPWAYYYEGGIDFTMIGALKMQG